jgi:hypothetical protein
MSDEKKQEGEIKKAERELIETTKPLINQMGIDAAEKRHKLNELTQSQLLYVREMLSDYVPVADKDREWDEDEERRQQMPHEWGSMDTYDDMRNSLHLASIMLDNVITPEMFVNSDADITTDEGVRQFLREVMVKETGFLAGSKAVEEFVDNGDPDWMNKGEWKDQ